MLLHSPAPFRAGSDPGPWGRQVFWLPGALGRRLPPSRLAV